MGTSSQTEQDLGCLTALGIARRLGALGWDFERLATESGMSWEDLVSYRADAGGMSMNELAAITQALGTTPAALMSEVARREYFGCPDWCARTDHSPEEVDEDTPPLHYGPEFGHAWPQGTSTDDLSILVDLEDPLDLTAEDARAMGNDLLAAAQWLETHR